MGFYLHPSPRLSLAITNCSPSSPFLSVWDWDFIGIIWWATSRGWFFSLKFPVLATHFHLAQGLCPLCYMGHIATLKKLFIRCHLEDKGQRNKLAYKYPCYYFIISPGLPLKILTVWAGNVIQWSSACLTCEALTSVLENTTTVRARGMQVRSLAAFRGPLRSVPGTHVVFSTSFFSCLFYFSLIFFKIISV